MKFAAIDVGSNAVRLLVSRIDEFGPDPLIKKEVLLRIPLRLGEEVFQHKRLSEERAGKFVKTMEAFANLIEVFQPESYLACATSAMRDAENGPQIVDQVYKRTGIQLRIISGKEEAEIIFNSHVERQLDPDQTYLFIDVGGGSTELILYDRGEIIDTQSFNVGGVRILNNALDPDQWQAMRGWVKETVHPLSPAAIGSGGNISRLNRMSHKDENRPISYKLLKRTHQILSELSYEERIRRYKLKPDRADVIVPAGQIYLSVMDWGGIDRIYVPKFGLADGLVRMQYDSYLKNNR